jgi:hypothetical protein
MESSPRHVGIEHQAPLVESGNVLNLLEVQLDLHLLILSNSRWVVHLLEHTHHTLQAMYIELEVPNLLLQILDVLKVHKPLSIPVIQLSLQLLLPRSIPASVTEGNGKP